VSHDPRYATDYVIGGTYLIQREVALRRLDDKFALFPPKRASDPEGTIRRGANFVSSISPGTQVIMTRLDLEKRAMAGDFVWIWGEVHDGPFSNTPLLLSFISRESIQTNTGISVPMVDSNFLRLVKQP
jgi:hypothetical protein